MLYVVAAFLAVLTFAFLVYAAVRWTRPGSPGVAWLFASFFLLLCVLLWGSPARIAANIAKLLRKP